MTDRSRKIFAKATYWEAWTVRFLNFKGRERRYDQQHKYLYLLLFFEAKKNVDGVKIMIIDSKIEHIDNTNQYIDAWMRIDSLKL